MAFSILRNGLKMGKSLHRLSKVSVFKASTEGRVAKLQSMKNGAAAMSCNQYSCLLVPKSTSKVHARDFSSKQAKTHQERKYLSSSESDSDLDQWIGQRGNSDFWRRKMRTFHAILDINKDGVIAFDDFKLLADRFVDLGNISEKHSKEFYQVIQELWEKLFGEITPYNTVSIFAFLDHMHHVLNDKRLVRHAHSFLPYLFKAVDKDQSGEITVEEFKLFFDILGINEIDAVVAFRSIDTNGDGKISSKEFVKHGREFFVTEDPERISKYFWGPLVDH